MGLRLEGSVLRVFHAFRFLGFHLFRVPKAGSDTRFDPKPKFGTASNIIVIDIDTILWAIGSTCRIHCWYQRTSYAKLPKFVWKTEVRT